VCHRYAGHPSQLGVHRVYPMRVMTHGRIEKIQKGSIGVLISFETCLSGSSVGRHFPGQTQEHADWRKFGEIPMIHSRDRDDVPVRRV